MDPCWVPVFLAITDCTVENGCLAVLPGSHREPFMEAEFDPDDRHHALTRQPSIRNVDMERVVRMELAAGEMGLFHSHVVHGSGANRFADRRIGLIIHRLSRMARRQTPGLHCLRALQGARGGRD